VKDERLSKRPSMDSGSPKPKKKNNVNTNSNNKATHSLTSKDAQPEVSNNNSPYRKK
jgi:hypothetical protein